MNLSLPISNPASRKLRFSLSADFLRGSRSIFPRRNHFGTLIFSHVQLKSSLLQACKYYNSELNVVQFKYDDYAGDYRLLPR